MKATAHARRSDGWWAISVPEVPGLFTQSKRLSRVPGMVTDAVRLMLDEPDLDVDVAVVGHVGPDDVFADALKARAARIRSTNVPRP